MCGVSVMTVSRALRPNSPVAPQTRQRILEAAESLGYRPALNMGRPRRTETLDRQSVDVILAMATKPLFYSALLVSIEQELTRRWHDCVIRTCGTDYAQFLTLCEVLRSRDSMGTLVLGYMPVEQLQALLDVAPDAILVDHTGDSRLTSPYRSIGFDNAEAARLAVRHLLAAGRRRIALVRGPADHYFTRDVEQGYRECLREARVKVREELILDTDFTAAHASWRKHWRTSASSTRFSPTTRWPAAYCGHCTSTNSGSRKTLLSSVATGCPLANTSCRA